jgi:hypothetical protein
MSTSRMAFDISRARAELGYAPRPATEALESSARWFAASGLVYRRRLHRMRWASDTSLVGAPPPVRSAGPVKP